MFLWRSYWGSLCKLCWAIIETICFGQRWQTFQPKLILSMFYHVQHCGWGEVGCLWVLRRCKCWNFMIYFMFSIRLQYVTPFFQRYPNFGQLQSVSKLYYSLFLHYSLSFKWLYGIKVTNLNFESNQSLNTIYWSNQKVWKIFPKLSILS